MRKKIIIIGTFVLLFISCENKTEPPLPPFHEIQVPVQQESDCPYCDSGIRITYYGARYCDYCKGRGKRVNVVFKKEAVRTVSTKKGCSRCDCDGYIGIEHLNGTYEGNCSNSDGHGHTCRHSPKNHGLSSW